MELLILGVVVLGVLGFTSYREYLYSKERRDMLDRLMSKDLTDLKVSQDVPEDNQEDGDGVEEDYIPLTDRVLSKDEKEEIYG